jgi:DNA-directed RNA polymerase subunit alpha
MDKIPLPNKFELKDVDTNRSVLTIEPLFAGYGITIGNALRRVLLSSIPGSAVTSVKIKGADHEFSTLDGVQEDVVDIILNIKQLKLKVHSDEDVRFTLKKKGKGAVTAADIEGNADVEIVDKDLPIATLTDDKTELEIEFVANRGRGYTPTETRDEEKKEIGMIAVDSIYTPITNVSMNVENVRVGQVTNFEQVTLDIETDGSISVKEAVALAGQILVDHFSIMLESDLEPQTERTDIEPEPLEGEMEEEAPSSEVEAPAPKKRGRPKKTKEEDTEEAE